MITRERAMEIVQEHTENKNLIKHMLAVEAAMRFYAEKFNGDNEEIEKWGVLGLLHDFDYEKMGAEHPSPWGYDILRGEGVTEDMIQAIQGHADSEDLESRPDLMAKTLFAVDELTGFIVACSLPRPEQISSLEVSSVKKKMKDKSFANGVSRDHMQQGAQEIGVEFDEHVQNVINAMRVIKEELGLK